MTPTEFIAEYNKNIEILETEVYRYLYVKYAGDKRFKGQAENKEWIEGKERAIKALENARNQLVVVRLEYNEEPERVVILEGDSLMERTSESIHLGKQIKVKSCDVERECDNWEIDKHKPTEIGIHNPLPFEFY